MLNGLMVIKLVIPLRKLISNMAKQSQSHITRFFLQPKRHIDADPDLVAENTGKEKLNNEKDDDHDVTDRVPVSKKRYLTDSSPDDSSQNEEEEEAGISQLGKENVAIQTQQADVITKNPKKRKPFVQKSREVWKTKFSWMKDDKDGNSFCVYCKRTIAGSYTHMSRHEKTETHIRKTSALKHVVNIKQYSSQMDEKKVFNQKVKECELKLVMLIVEHNLPMLLMEHLPKLLQSAVPDSDILKAVQCSRTKTTRLLENYREQSETDISDILKSGIKYSIIVDETTDISTKKCLAILVRYFDTGMGQVRDRLLSLVEVEDVTADGILRSILNVLENLKIPLQNLIGFAADNCNVMMGQFGGVQAKLKQYNENVFVIGCICHSLHLAASAAAKKLPSALEDFVRDIYNYLSCSSKRLADFKEFQDYVNVKPHKILRPSQTRWLSSEMVVQRTLQQWSALQLFFRMAALEDNLESARIIQERLEDITFKLHLTFLAYILPLVNKMNLEFQSEQPKLYSVYTRIETICKTILKNFMNASYIDKMLNVNKISIININEHNAREYQTIENLYLGVKTTEIIERLDRNNPLVRRKINEFRINCLNYYVELYGQLKKRFQNLEMYKSFTSLNPEYAMQNGANITPLLLQFQHMYEDSEEVSSEYRELCNLPEELRVSLKPLNMEEFWVRISELKNAGGEKCYRNLSSFVFNIMSLPHSSAAAERIFSTLTNIKTKNRNRLLPSTCNNLLQSKELLDGKACYQWTPAPELLRKNVPY